MDSNKLKENYTEFASPGVPSWLAPQLTQGRFYSRFFANKAKPVIAREDPNAKQSSLIPADAGDTVINTDLINSNPTIGLNRSTINLGQLEYRRKERYKEFEEMDEYPEIGCLAGGCLIFTLDRGWVKIEDLAKETKEFFVIAYDSSTKSLVPAKASSCRKTASDGHSKAMVSVVLDNGQKINCTSDHLFLTKDEKWIEAGNLQTGTRLMPGATRMRQLGGTGTGHYWQIHQPFSESAFKSVSDKEKRWIFVHHLIKNFVFKNYDPNLVAHHKDHNSLNNNPSNLELVTHEEHAKIHLVEIDNFKYFPIWTPERRKEVSLRMLGNQRSKGNKLSAETKAKLSQIRKGKPKTSEHKENIGNAHRIKFTQEQVEAAYKSTNSIVEMANLLGVSWSTARRALDRYDLISDHSNHRVLRVEHLYTAEAVYDIEVPQYHNFLCDGIIVHNSSFDIYADECTQKGTNGERWQIKSNSEVIKKEIEYLFKRISFDNFYWDVCRNTVKYGDCFIEAVTDLSNPKEGVQRIKILNPSFIIRSENEYGYLEGFLQEIPDKDNWQSYGAQSTNMSNSKFIPLDREQIIHFRLHTSNPFYYPYGKSIAANARRVFKSLQMMEDAMLIYRLNRAPERRAFYINVGQLPPAKAHAAIEELKQSFKKQKFYDRNSNNVDNRYNPIAVDEDFYIPIRSANDGTKIENLAGAGNLGEIEDVRYFRDKLLAILKIPKDFLVEKDKSPERKANLSQLDVKFARTIVRVQQCVQLGIQQLARLHLALKNFPQTEIDNLEVCLPDPSDLSIKRKLDNVEQLARAVKALQGLGMFSKNYLYKNFFELSEQDIQKMNDELEKDVSLETQGILPAIHPVGGGMEDPMGGGMLGEENTDVPVDSPQAESKDSLESRYKSGGSDSRENNQPTKESIRCLLTGRIQLSEQAQKVLTKRMLKLEKSK